MPVIRHVCAPLQTRSPFLPELPFGLATWGWSEATIFGLPARLTTGLTVLAPVPTSSGRLGV